jgi:hypothetical protein
MQLLSSLTFPFGQFRKICDMLGTKEEKQQVFCAKEGGALLNWILYNSKSFLLQCTLLGE